MEPSFPWCACSWCCWGMLILVALPSVFGWNRGGRTIANVSWPPTSSFGLSSLSEPLVWLLRFHSHCALFLECSYISYINAISLICTSALHMLASSECHPSPHIAVRPLWNSSFCHGHLLGHSSYFSDRACPVPGWCPGLSSTLGNSSEHYFLILFFPLFPNTICSSLSFFCASRVYKPTQCPDSWRHSILLFWTVFLKIVWWESLSFFLFA